MKRTASDSDSYLVLSGKAKPTVYYNTIFPVEKALSTILGCDNEISDFITTSWMCGTNINVHMDYICGDDHKDIVHTIKSALYNGATFSNLVESTDIPNGEADFVDVDVVNNNHYLPIVQTGRPLSNDMHREQVMANIKLQLAVQIRQKISEFSPYLTELYYTGISVTSFTNDLAELFSTISIGPMSGLATGLGSLSERREIHTKKVPKSRIHVLDFDTPWDSSLGKEIGCSTCHYKYADFGSFNNLLFYQIGCLYNIILLADFVYYSHTQKPFLPSDPLYFTSLKSPMSNLMAMSFFRRRLEEWRKEKLRVFFSGSKGIHTYINSDILGPEGSIYTEMEDMFSPKMAAGFSGLFGIYLRWLVKSILFESRAEGIITCDRSLVCDATTKSMSYNSSKNNQNIQITTRIKDFVSLSKSINFDMRAIAENYDNAKLSSVSAVTTKSSIGFWLKKLCLYFFMKTPLFETNKCTDIWQWLKFKIVDDFMINKTFNDVVGEYSELSAEQKDLVRDFCCAFILFNPLLVGDSAVNSINQKMRVPYSFHNKSSMISFELPVFVSPTDNFESVSFDNLRESVKREWTQGRDFLSS